MTPLPGKRSFLRVVKVFDEKELKMRGDGDLGTRGRIGWIVLPAAVLLAGAGAWAADTGPMVFAAASLKTAMDEIATQYEAETGLAPVVTYAGSSALARQIQQGAPADLFISANVGWMDALEDDGLIVSESRVDLLGNALVLISHDAVSTQIDLSSETDLPEMLGDNHLAMALVDAVPAGIYGKASLESLGLWEGVAPLVAQADNVRAALALVALGEAPLGITYATDAVAEPRVSVLGVFPEDSHPPFIYPAAPLSEGDRASAEPFLTYLKGAAARGVFEANGFTVLAGD